MQVLQVILAGKGQKNLEIYQRKQYLKAQLDCCKTALHVSKEYFCLSLCCTSTFFYGYDFPCFFQNYILLELLTCYFVFEVNVI